MSENTTIRAGPSGTGYSQRRLRQYAHLVSEENRLLPDEVDRCRRHVTKLIDMRRRIPKSDTSTVDDGGCGLSIEQDSVLAACRG